MVNLAAAAEAGFAAFSETNQDYPIPVYTPAGGSPVAIDGIFDLPTAEVLPLSDAPPVTTRQARLDILVSDWVALFPSVPPLQRDAVTVRGVAYQVSDVRPDGVAVYALTLSESAS